MIRILYLFLIFISISYGNEDLLIQKQNVLYVQNLIEKEEAIAKNFEKYLLTEFAIPSINNLLTNDYLGVNFSTSNMMGNSIDFQDASNLKIKYSITRAELLNSKNYIFQIYTRELYRDYTTVNSVYKGDKLDLDNSYVGFTLKSSEAKNILNILKSGKKINKSCKTIDKNNYCINDSNTRNIRYYFDDSNWIEYSIKDFENGNVVVSDTVVLNKTEVQNLKIGTHILIKNNGRYIKFVDNKFLEVN